MHLCYRTSTFVKELVQYVVDFHGKDEQSVLIIWQILTFGLNIHPDFLSNNITNALKGLSQPPPSQTFCDIRNHKRHWLLSELRLLSSSQLRHSGVSGTPPLSSAWRCTRTCPFPPWPSSWRWDRGLCSVTASAPHLRLASVERKYLKHLMQTYMQHTSVWYRREYIIYERIIYLLG